MQRDKKKKSHIVEWLFVLLYILFTFGINL